MIMNLTQHTVNQRRNLFFYVLSVKVLFSGLQGLIYGVDYGIILRKDTRRYQHATECYLAENVNKTYP